MKFSQSFRALPQSPLGAYSPPPPPRPPAGEGPCCARAVLLRKTCHRPSFHILRTSAGPVSFSLLRPWSWAIVGLAYMCSHLSQAVHTAVRNEPEPQNNTWRRTKICRQIHRSKKESSPHEPRRKRERGPKERQRKGERKREIERKRERERDRKRARARKKENFRKAFCESFQ